MEQEKTIVTMSSYVEAIHPAYKLAIERNEKYGDSISYLRNSSIVDLVMMKLSRTKTLDEKDVKNYDEIIDCVNYLVFLLMRCKNESN